MVAQGSSYTPLKWGNTSALDAVVNEATLALKWGNTSALDAVVKAWTKLEHNQRFVWKFGSWLKVFGKWCVYDVCEVCVACVCVDWHVRVWRVCDCVCDVCVMCDVCVTCVWHVCDVCVTCDCVCDVCVTVCVTCVWRVCDVCMTVCMTCVCTYLAVQHSCVMCGRFELC